MRKFHPSYDLLTLENFQSIKNRTEIPIRPLTFLYGPNSAGKSSVLDALSFMEAFFKSERSVVRQMIERWVHITKSNGPSEVQDATCMTVAVKFTDEYSMFQTGEPFWSPDDGDLPEEFQNSPLFDKNKLKSKSDSLNILDTIGISIKADSRDLDLLSLTIFSNGTNILKISPVEDDDNDHYEGRDDCILELFCEGFGIKLADLAKRHGNFQEGKKSYKAPCNLLWGQINLAGHSSHSYPFERDLIAIGNSVLKYLKLLTFTPPNVDSDRGTLLNHHLITFQSFFRPSLKARSQLTLAPTLVFNSLMNLSPRVMVELAASKFQEQEEIWTVDEESQPLTPVTDSDTAMLAFNRGLGQVLKGLAATLCGPETLHTFVNRCLSEHLFLDQGYQLTYDVCRVLPSELSGSTNDQVFAALIVCALIDNAGRSLTFEDVGTGISCVLPVLTALYAQESFIQQPELHLHPALQSALADILVERAKSWGGSARHIIETHSEYLLLRCLRRIRETTLGKQLPNSSLSLSKEDVSVLYFDPQPDGTTTVKQLRVSTQGDFIDRWPRGFFDERAKDIFDE